MPGRSATRFSPGDKHDYAKALRLPPLPVFLAESFDGREDVICGRMDFVGNGFDQGDQEGRCGNTIGFFGKLDEGELRSSVDRHEEVELSLGGLHFGDVDVEEADRIRPELFLCRLVAFDLSKTADPMPLLLRSGSQ